MFAIMTYNLGNLFIIEWKNMPKSSPRGDAIKRFILKNIQKHPQDVISVTSKEFEISKQAVNRYIRQLEKEKLISSDGYTRNKQYSLLLLYKNSFKFELKNLQEHLVWQNNIASLLKNMPENVQDIWHYGCTEMINNAIDHSEGKQLSLYIELNAVNTKIWIDDNGIGIFKKIKNACKLEDERHAILELAKGKLTTDPDNHTGQGIFFSSRMFDQYMIFSGDVSFSHDFENDKDWIFERERPNVGTQVFMQLSNDSERTEKEIFDKFSSADDDFGFTKTVVPVRLGKHDAEKLISRSQAKRLMVRVDRFKIVILDFKGIESVGQAFADEIFRVFATQHKNIEILHVHANKNIQNMINRTKNDT